MNKKSRKLLTWCLVLCMVLTQMLFTNVAFAATKLSGADRYQTALEIVKAGWTSSDSAVIARGDDLADALAAAPLAYAKGKAPILLTETNALPAGVLDELKALGVKKVYIVGGTGAVSTAVEDALKAEFTVKRLAGANRFATALAVANEAFPTAPSKVVLVNGYAYADALSVSSIAAYNGMPILLVDKNAVTPEVSAYLTGKTVYAVGGTGVISDAVAGNATRLAGADRYATNAKILEAFTLDYSKVYVAKGTDDNMVDALAGSALAALTNSPIVLCNDNSSVAAANSVLSANLKANSEVVRLGGTVSESVVSTIQGLLPATLSATVSAVKADTLKVTFNRAVDTSKASFGVSKDSININYSSLKWNDAKTEATIVLYNNMTAGDYTVTVSGLTDTALTSTVTVQDQKVTKIEFTSDKLVQSYTIDEINHVLVADPTFVTTSYKLYDQYGTDVTDDYDSEISFVTTVGSVDDSTDGVLTLTASGSGFTLDSKVIVNAIDTTSGAYANATLTVAPMARVAKITLGNLTPNDDVTDTKLYYSSSNNNFGDFYIPVTAEDQYGNSITDPNFFNADVQPILNNISVSVAYDSDLGSLVLNLTPATGQTTGTASITFIGKGTGVRADKTLTVNKYGEIADFSMSIPSLVVAGDLAIEVPFTAVDQYGNAVTDVTMLNNLIHSAGVSGITGITNDVFYFEKDIKTNTTKLHLDLSSFTVTSATKVYVNMVINSYKLYTTTFTVQKNAVPTTISGTKDGTEAFIPNVVVGASATLGVDNFVIKDQYNRTMSLPNGYSIALTTSDSSKVSLSASTIDNDTTTTLDAEAAGNATIKATLYQGVNAVTGSSYSFTAKAVKASDVASFEVAPLGTLYAPTVEDADYEKSITVTGKLADGSKVVLNKEVAIKNVMSTNESVLTVVDDAENGYASMKAKAVPVASDRPTDSATAAVIVTIDSTNGPVIISTPVTISYAAPVANTIEASSDVENGVYYVESDNVNNALNQFVVTDQYGVDITNKLSTGAARLTYAITNVVSDGSVTLSSGSIVLDDVEAGDYFTLTAITPNGKALSIKVVITE